MRHQCCHKQKVKRGLWSPQEDHKLVTHITMNGHGSWSSVPKLAGLQRCGKSCRLRWINYLRPDLKRGSFIEEEERTIIEVHRILGNRWAQIAKHLPGRTDNEVKNFWNSCIKKKLIAQGLDPNTHNLLPSNHNKSKNSTTTNAPKTAPISNSLAFSIDQPKNQDNIITKVNQSSFISDNNNTELHNIDFSCTNHQTNTQKLDAISEYSTQCLVSNSTKMCENDRTSFNMNPCDMFIDENSMWNSTLGSFEQPMSTIQVFPQQHYPETSDKIGTIQEEVTHDQGFEATFNTPCFDYCFEDEYGSTTMPDTLYGDVISVMEQVAWGSC